MTNKAIFIAFRHAPQLHHRYQPKVQLPQTHNNESTVASGRYKYTYSKPDSFWFKASSCPAVTFSTHLCSMINSATNPTKSVPVSVSKSFQTTSASHQYKSVNLRTDSCSCFISLLYKEPSYLLVASMIACFAALPLKIQISGEISRHTLSNERYEISVS